MKVYVCRFPDFTFWYNAVLILLCLVVEKFLLLMPKGEAHYNASPGQMVMNPGNTLDNEQYFKATRKYCTGISTD